MTLYVRLYIMSNLQIKFYQNPLNNMNDRKDEQDNSYIVYLRLKVET